MWIFWRLISPDQCLCGSALFSCSPSSLEVNCPPLHLSWYMYVLYEGLILSHIWTILGTFIFKKTQGWSIMDSKHVLCYCSFKLSQYQKLISNIEENSTTLRHLLLLHNAFDNWVRWFCSSQVFHHSFFYWRYIFNKYQSQNCNQGTRRSSLWWSIFPKNTKSWWVDPRMLIVVMMYMGVTMVIMVMGMENVVTLNGVDDDGVILGDDAYLQVNIAMTATYMIFGLSLFWMVFHLVQVNFRTSSSKCFHNSFHSFHSSRLLEEEILRHTLNPFNTLL